MPTGQERYSVTISPYLIIFVQLPDYVYQEFGIELKAPQSFSSDSLTDAFWQIERIEMTLILFKKIEHILFHPSIKGDKISVVTTAFGKKKKEKE